MRAYILLLICGIFLASCTGGGGSNVSKEDPYHQGKEGIVMTFQDSSTTKKVYAGDDFNIIAFVENRGAFSLAKKLDESGNIVSDDYGVIPEIDYLPDAIQSDYEHASLPHLYLNGKSEFYPKGDGEVEEYAFHAKALTGERQYETTPISFFLCYPYETELMQDVCIDKDYYNMDVRKKVCQIKEISLSKGQGAPVAITRVEPRALKKGDTMLVEFIITIENVGGGRVRLRDMERDIHTQCTENDQSKKTYDTMTIEANLLGRDLKCGDGTVILKENKAEVRCSTDSLDDSVRDNSGAITGNARNFMSRLYVKLSYLYESTAAKTIEIQRFE